MKQVNAVPDRAASFVVHPTPGIGDATTIAEGLALVQQAGGGDLFLREGTYSISSTLTLPAGIPATIRGCGNATIIALGANAIPAFTVPTGAVTNTPIVFKNFKVTGTEVATQTFLTYSDDNGLAEIYMENIVTTGVEVTISSTSSASASATPGVDDPRFHMFRCRIRPNATNNSVILSNPGVGVPRAWLKEVEFIGDSLFAVPGLRTDPLFGKLAATAGTAWDGDCYLDTCELSVGTGESDFATFDCIDSIIWNNDSANPAVEYLLFGTFSSHNIGNGTVQGSAFNGINFNLSGDSINLLSNWLQNCPITMFGQGVVLGDNTLINVGTFPPAFDYGVQANNNDQIIRDNRVRFQAATPTKVIDIESVSCRVMGNDFSECHPPTNGTILIDTNGAVITDNIFTFVPTTGPNVKEVNGPNYYDNNSQLFTNKTGGGPIVDPIIPNGGGSCVQGMLPFSAAGSVGGVATNSIVVWYRNPMGLAQTKGYIKNTGGVNNITVRETFITQDLGTFTRSTVITPGTQITLDPFDFTGIVGLVGNFQVVDYRVDVSGTTISWHTYFSAPDGVAAF